MSDDELTVQLASFSDEERIAGMKRFEIIRPAIESDVTLPTIAAETGIGLRTLRRWLKEYQTKGLSGLIRQKRNDRGERRLPADVVNLVQAMALRKPPFSLANVQRQVAEICAKQDWQCPSYGQVYNIVKKLDSGLLVLAHEGSKAYESAFDLIFRREAERPNEMWQADHTPLDILVVTPSGKPRRPWLTAIIDDYSRAVPGYFIGLESPSALRTSLALRQAIWRKTESQWHVCGMPESFYSDHGSDFTSRHMEQVAADLKFQLHFSTIGRPRGRGKIERFFGTVNELFLSLLPGYFPPDTIERPEPVLTLDELEMSFKEWLINVYLNRVHSEIGMAPQIRWEQSGFIPRMPDSLEQLDLLLLTVAKTRRVHKDGIRFNGLRFIDTTLAGYVGEDIVIRYDPRDLAEIRVYHDGRFLCRAVCSAIANQTLSLKAVIEARRNRKKELRGTLREHSQFIDNFLQAHHPKPAASPTPEFDDCDEDRPELKRYRDD